MIRWDWVISLAIAAFGVLAFLKVVCDEVVIKHRVLELRVEAEAEEAEKRKKEKRPSDPAAEEKPEDIPTVAA